MALYAIDKDDLIFAAEAESGKTYWCLDCLGPVKRRRGKYSFYHFYHLQTSSRCRLYSKTEDHLLAQLQLQKRFPEGTLQLERPFLEINRVADLCWESCKVVFEIQCSPITPKEAEMRIRDYRSSGYEVLWLLDDKRYNKRALRPAEAFLRTQWTYYLSIRQGLYSEYYDQFEVFAEGKRVKRGRPLSLDLRTIQSVEKKEFSEELFPKQILQLDCRKYCPGDRLGKALQNHFLTMRRWRSLEEQFGKERKVKSVQFWQTLTRLYMQLLDTLLKKC